MTTDSNSSTRCGTTSTIWWTNGCPYVYPCGKKACELDGKCPGGYGYYQPNVTWTLNDCSYTATTTTAQK